jgi:thiosulfate/3-mercaptopyruvate sulfurtransferase
MSRYVVVGAGAVGASIAAELHQAGIATLLIARGAHAEALKTQGLSYVRPDRTRRLLIPVAQRPEDVTLAADDVLVFATKTQDTPGAVRDWAWQPVKRADGSVTVAAHALPAVTVQNGLDNERVVLRSFARVIGGVVWLPATFLVPGEVVNPGTPAPGVIWAGVYPGGGAPGGPAGVHPVGPAEDLARIAGDLRAAGFRVYEVDAIRAYKSAKLLDNLVNALDALYPPSALRARAVSALRAEAEAVLGAAGLPIADYRSGADGFHAAEIPGKPRGGSSTWQSLARSGTPETDFLNGEVVLLGRLHGVPAPLNAALQARLHRAVAEGLTPGSLGDDDLAATLRLPA